MYRQPKHMQPVIQAAQAQATSYIGSASTGNQSYTQTKHRPPVVRAIQPSTAHQLYRQLRHRQPVTEAARAQATSYTGSASTGNELLQHSIVRCSTKEHCMQELIARNDARVVTMHASELPVALQDIIDSIIQSMEAPQSAHVFLILMYIVVALRQESK